MPISIYMFHDIYIRGVEDIEYPQRWGMRSFLPFGTFLERLDYIEENYTIISLASDLSNLDPKIEYAILTLDDGMKTQYDYAFKTLQQRSIPATFFIPSAPVKSQTIMTDHKIQFLIAAFDGKYDTLIGHILDHVSTQQEERDMIYNEYCISKWKGRNNWWTSDEVFITRFFREYQSDNGQILNNLFTRFVDISQRLYMNIDEVKEIVNTPGMTVGGHGWKSINMEFAHPNDIIHEIRHTKTFLEDIGMKRLFFAYPNGSSPRQATDLLRELGFEYALTTVSGKYESSILKSPLHVGRIDGSQHTFSPKIVICGVQEQLVEILYYLRKNGIYVTHVVTITEKEATRQKASGWVSYEGRLPQDVKLKYLDHYSMKNNEDDYLYFQQERFDVLILGGWQRLLPERVLRTIEYGGIGQHGSSDYLPKYRGRSPINWSIILGKKRIVWHIFFMTAGVDDGEIIDFETFQINEWDDCNTIYYKISIVVKEMYKKNIPKILSGDVETITQKGEITFYEKRTPEDGKISFDKSMYDIYNLVRGVTRPYPGAFCYSGNKKVMIWKCQPFDSHLQFYISKKYGEIVEVFDDGNYIVKAEEGLLLITESDDSDVKVGDVYF